MAVSGTFFVSAPLATVLIRAPVIINGIRVIANNHTVKKVVLRQHHLLVSNTCAKMALHVVSRLTPYYGVQG